MWGCKVVRLYGCIVVLFDDRLVWYLMNCNPKKGNRVKELLRTKLVQEMLAHLKITWTKYKYYSVWKNHPNTNANTIGFEKITWIRIRIRILVFSLNYSNSIRITNYSLTSVTLVVWRVFMFIPCSNWFRIFGLNSCHCRDMEGSSKGEAREI